MEEEDLHNDFFDFVGDDPKRSLQEEMKSYLQESDDQGAEALWMKQLLSDLNELPVIKPSENLEKGFLRLLAEEKKLMVSKTIFSKDKTLTPSLPLNRWFGIAASVALISIMTYLLGKWDLENLSNKKTAQKQETLKKEEPRPILEPELKKEEASPIIEKNEETSAEYFKEDVPKIKFEKQIGLAENKPQTIQDRLVETSINNKNESPNHSTPLPVLKKSMDISPNANVQNSSQSNVGYVQKKDEVSQEQRARSRSSEKDEVQKSKKTYKKDVQSIASNDLTEDDIQKLLEILKSNGKVNQKVAALEQLKSMSLELKSQNQIAEFLESESSPIVQVAIMEYIVQFRVKTAKKNVQELLKNNGLDDFVKEYAQNTLKVIA